MWLAFAHGIDGTAALADQDTFYGSAAYDVIRRMMPVEVWGVIFLLAASVATVAVVLSARSMRISVHVARIALTMSAMIHAVWAWSIGARILDGQVLAITGVTRWLGGAVVGVIFLTDSLIDTRWTLVRSIEREVERIRVEADA
jgi:hypothetical protein